MRKLIGLFFLAGLTLVLVATMPRGSLAVFTDTAPVSGNTFTTATSLPTATPTPPLIRASFGAVADTYVKEDRATDNFGTDTDMQMKADANSVKRSLVAFDVSTIPAIAAVSSATLTLCLSSDPASGSQGRTEELRLVTSSWTETGVTWNTQPTVSGTVTDTIAVPATAQCLTFTVTADVQAWLDGTGNHGWRLGDQTEDTSSGDVKYRTWENGTTAERPKLDVTYTIPTPTPAPTPTPTSTATPCAGFCPTATAAPMPSMFALAQYATSATASSEWLPGDNGTAQAIGAPDTASCGDIETAWAPLAAQSDPEWLEATFEVPVYATGLTVYETFKSGYITQVDLIDTSGVYHTIWTGIDSTGCPGEFTITFAQTSYKVDGVKIYTATNGGENLDAVKLVGQSDLATGSTVDEHASSARASSQFSDGASNAMGASGLPDVTGCGNNVLAWAPATTGSGAEWLEVSFTLDVYATGVTVFETFNTGFITRVALIDTLGTYHTIWKGTDSTACPGEFTITFAQTSYKVNGVKISTQMADIEEIDAVKLTGAFAGP